MCGCKGAKAFFAARKQKKEKAGKRIYTTKRMDKLDLAKMKTKNRERRKKKRKTMTKSLPLQSTERSTRRKNLLFD